MPKEKLTAVGVRALRPKGGKRTEYWDTVVPGLVLRVSPTGAQRYSVFYTLAGKNGRVTLGPEGRFTLAEARDKAREILDRAAQGRDPRKKRSAELTVEQLVLRSLKDLTLRPKTRKEEERLARVEVIPALGPMSVRALERSDVREWAKAIVARGRPYIANRAFGVLRRAYNWGLRNDLVGASPFPGLQPPGREEPSERVLSAPEIRAVWLALEEIGGLYPDAVRMLFLTGVRRDMVLGMKRSELEELDGNEPRWAIPGGTHGRSKSQRPHVVPLSPQALKIVEKRLAHADELLFPARGVEPERPMTWSSRFVAELRQAAELVQKSPMERWTIHNIRHTVGTHLREDLKIPREVVSAILGHAQAGPAATRIYDRSELLPERRTALVAWADWLDRLVSGEGRGKVVPLVRSGG